MRDVLNLYCPPHDWKSLGGCNAGCCDDCACSVPVHECARCKDCDYGETEERAEIIAACHVKNGKPAGAMGDAELAAEFERVGAAFDEVMASDEGRGGSPDEWAYERCGELEQEMKRRGIPVPVSN